MSVAVSQMTRERACLSSAFFLTSGDSTLTPLVLVLLLAVQWTVMEANQIRSAVCPHSGGKDSDNTFLRSESIPALNN